jgi:hypothetical protein
MSAAYWGQWDHSEMQSMHCLTIDNEDDLDCDMEEKCLYLDDCCDRCSGRGCNYCLL